MTDEQNAAEEKSNQSLILRISGILAVIVMAVSSFQYIPDDDPGGGEILTGIFMGACTGSAVLVLGWLVKLFVGNFTLTSQSTKESNQAVKELAPQKSDQLNQLLRRVPFVSLSVTIGGMIGCGLISVGAFAALIIMNPPPSFLREFLLRMIIITGFGAFCFWSCFPRRKEYRDRFVKMLKREPVATWSYTDEEWKRWLEFSQTLAYGKSRRSNPKRTLIVILVVSLMGGGFLRLLRSESTFIESFLLCAMLLSLPVVLYYLYWQHLQSHWKQAPSEARFFEKGIFFHHKFIDWQGNEDIGVKAVIEQEDHPLPILLLVNSEENAKLAPHLDALIVPIPDDKIDEAIQLAESMTQNVNLQVEKIE